MKMDSSNVLSGGVETLYEIKDYILELEGYKTKYDTLNSEETKLEKNIQSTEKAIAEEISGTTKKRKQEIEDTFDATIDKTRARIKKIKGKRDKRKDTKISERIKIDTTQLREEKSQLTLEAKTVFNQNHIPALCNSRLFYALFSPRGLGDLLIIIGTILLALLVIPCGIYFYLLPVEKVRYLVLIYFITVIILGGLYVLIENYTKDKHPDAIKRVKELRSKIVKNKRKTASMQKEIKKDRDESRYGLEPFDEELLALEKEEDDIAEQKMRAMLDFENKTSFVIAEEIKERYEGVLSAAKNEYDKVCTEAKKAEDKVKALTMKMVADYEPLIGKEYMTLDKIDALIAIIQEKNANTVSEEVAFYTHS